MEFQTPVHVAQYMCSMIPEGTKTILEPTPGKGNILSALMNCNKAYWVTAADDFFKFETGRYDCVVMNPPFSARHGFNVPIDLNGMRLGYYILSECMKMSDHVIALMPWFTITDSDVRLREMKTYGLRSITALPRKTFNYSRIQTCIFELHKGWNQDTIFKVYELL